jgi:hypothetical protein
MFKKACLDNGIDIWVVTLFPSASCVMSKIFKRD